METFAKLIIKFRVPVLVLAVLITAALASALPKLYADDDLLQFLPGDDPDVQLFRRVNARFGGLDVAIVGLESESVFRAETLVKIREMTKKIAQVEGVFDVMSFTEVPDPQPAPDGLRVEPLVMDRVPTGEAELAELKRRVLANENAVGNMVSPDGKAAMILCFLGGKRPPIHVAADIKAVTSSIWTDDPIYYGGSPFIRQYIAGGTKSDMYRLTPVVAAVVLLVTFLIFRKPVGVLLALGSVGIALVWLMGLIAVRGKGLTLVGSSLPTISIAIGGAYGIHILGAYFGGKAPTVRERVIEAMREVGAPVIASAMTTCAGFLSFLVMDIAPLREFGLYSAIGVAFTGILAVTVIPAILSFGRRVPKKMGSALLAKPLGKIGAWAERRRAPALVVAALLAVAGIFGVMRVAPDPTLETFFSEGSDPDQANEFLERHFGGSVYLQVYFEGDMRSPFVLAQLRKIVEYAKGMDEVVNVNSIIDPLTMMSEAMGGRADLPVNHRRTGFLYPFLEGTAAIDQIISPQKDASLVQIRLKDIPPQRVDAALNELRDFISKEVPRGIKVVQLAPFADPADRDEFIHPEVIGEDGQVITAAEPVVIDEVKDPARLAELRHRVGEDVAKRIVRIAAIHGERAEAGAWERVLKVLEAEDGKSAIAPGDDLSGEVRKLVAEHVASEVPAFEEPMEDASEEELDEWSRRGELVTGALLPRAGERLDMAAMTEIVGGAMPITSRRDPEGLELTAAALVAGMTMSRATVRGGRLATPALASIGLNDPGEEIKDEVAWAITDLDQPVHGFSDTGANSSTVLARVTGQPVINVAMCESTIDNQLRSLAVALVVLALIMSVFFRSVMSALKGLAPAIFMLALSVGVMGAAAIPIDLTTSMIAAIALGIGVDYAIHFLWRRRRRGESLGKTTAQVGPSIAANAVQVAAGFAVISISDMVPMQRFGLLVALTMLLSATATFVLLPALRAQGAEAVAQEEDEDATVRSSSS